MLTPVLFTVYGEPSPQGGTKSVPIRAKGGAVRGYRKITEGGVNLKSWRQDVSIAARAEAERHGCFDGPVRLEIQFRFQMPKSRPKWAHVQGWLLRVGKPDTDKLIRAVGDSLKVGGLIKDDALVAQLKVEKVECSEGWIGAAIRVTALDQHAFREGFW